MNDYPEINKLISDIKNAMKITLYTSPSHPSHSTIKFYNLSYAYQVYITATTELAVMKFESVNHVNYNDDIITRFSPSPMIMFDIKDKRIIEQILCLIEDTSNISIPSEWWGYLQ